MAKDNVEMRKCLECGETFVDRGADECPFCGSPTTVVSDEEPIKREPARSRRSRREAKQ